MGRPNTNRIAALAGAACISLTALGLGGCESSATTKPLLTIAVAQPDSGELAGRAQDMRDAAELALKQTNFDTPEHELKLVDASSANASTVGMINALADYGPNAGLDPKVLTVRLSIPPVKRARNSIWLLPSGFDEGQALGQFIAGEGGGSAGFIGGGTKAGTIDAGFTDTLSRAGIAKTPKPKSHPNLPLSVAYSSIVAASADDPTTPGTPSGAYVTPALAPDSYPPSGKRFFESFKDDYGHEPDRYAIYGYEAAGLIVDAIQRAEENDAAFSAEKVRKDAFSIKNRFGPTGHYDVLPDGSTTHYIFEARGEDAPPQDASLIEVQR